MAAISETAPVAPCAVRHLFRVRVADAELWFIRLSVILIALMNVYKDGLLRWVSVAAYCGILFVSTVPRLLNKVLAGDAFTGLSPRTYAPTYLLYLGLVAAAYLRSVGVHVLASLSVSSLLIFGTIVYVAFITVIPAAAKNDGRYLQAIFESLDIFLVANMLCYLMGLRGDSRFINSGDYGTAKLLGLVGITHDRILFPFTPGLTVFGVLAGASMCSSVVGLFEKTEGKKAYSAVMLAISTCALLLSDARGAVLFSLIVLGLYFLLLRVRIGWGRYLVAPLAFFFIIVLALMLLLSQYDLFSDMSRGGGLLSGRPVIWMSAFNYIADLPPALLFGHGFMGHFRSGISNDYAMLFISWGMDHPEFATLHNSFLQNLLDIGVVGLALLLATLQQAVNAASSSENYPKVTAMKIVVLILYLELSGATESCLTVYSFVTYLPLLLLVSYVVTNRRSVAPRARKRAASACAGRKS